MFRFVRCASWLISCNVFFRKISSLSIFFPPINTWWEMSSQIVDLTRRKFLKRNFELYRNKDVGRYRWFWNCAFRGCESVLSCNSWRGTADYWLLRGLGAWGGGWWSIARLVPIERLPADWHFASCKPEVIQCQWPAVVEYFFSCPVSASAFNSGHNSGLIFLFLVKEEKHHIAIYLNCKFMYCELW